MTNAICMHKTSSSIKSTCFVQLLLFFLYIPNSCKYLSFSFNTFLFCFTEAKFLLLFNNFDHTPKYMPWFFCDSSSISEMTHTGGGLPKSLRHWRSLFARLPGFIDKDIRNVSYLLLFPARKLSWNFLPRFLASFRNRFP